MANLAKEARDKAQVAWPGATVSERGRGWIKHQHPTSPRRVMLDSHIGPIHYGAGDDLEIDTAWEPGELPDAPWLFKMTKAGFNVYMGSGTTNFDAGQIVRYLHPASGEDVTFQAQQLQWANDLDQIEPIADPQQISHTSIDDDTIHWIGAYGPGLDFRWQAQTARLAKYLTIQDATAIGSPPQFIIDGGNPMLRLPFIFQKSSGIDIYIDGVLWNEKSNNPQTTSGNVEFRLDGESLWWFKQASAVDSSDDIEPPIIQQRFRAIANNLFVEVLVPWVWLETAVYPVEIDPTIDDQVGAGADDAHETYGGSGFNSTSVVVAIESNATQANAYIGGMRFDNIGLDGTETIDSGTYWEGRIQSPSHDDANFELYGHLVVNSVDFSSDADVATRYSTNPTTASASYIADAIGNNIWYDSTVEIKTIIQEIIDQGSWASGNAITLLAVGNGDAFKSLWIDSYDGVSADAAKLHIEYTAGGGSPYSITIGQGSYALTGQAVDFKASRKLAIAQGSYVQTGQPVAFKAARKLPITQGSYTLTGQDVAFKASRKLTIGQGSYTLSGQAVGLSRGYTLALAQGSYALTGQAAGFKVARKLALAQGSYVLSGQDIAFKAARKLVLAQGSYVLSGQDVAFKIARKLALVHGLYVLTGQDVLFTYTPVGGPTYTLALVQGSYVLSGQVVGLTASRNITITQGSYVLSGQDVTLTYTPLATYILALAQGGYALTGQNVGLIAARKLALAQGVYNLTGQDVGLIAARKLAIGQGSYVLSGQALDLLIARVLALNYGSYTLTGQDVTFDYSGSVEYIFDGDVAIRLVADGIVAVRLIADGDVAIRMTADGDVEL